LVNLTVKSMHIAPLGFDEVVVVLFLATDSVHHGV